ncbi:hypothetical protein CRG98_016387 [Punica granatum]|uniref:Uncharacterized protein n=1 Tax=Punica granatum TaxID=22663 RepID=A0A2I0K3T3_PUNGR|nr:hypothetical protein CRG98_016387 [Punica granatum]
MELKLNDLRERELGSGPQWTVLGHKITAASLMIFVSYVPFNGLSSRTEVLLAEKTVRSPQQLWAVAGRNVSHRLKHVSDEGPEQTPIEYQKLGALEL